jgi:hypothetical protein
MNYAYFLEEGLASVVVTAENGKTVEIGVVGKEGGSVAGIPILLGQESEETRECCPRVLGGSLRACGREVSVRNGWKQEFWSPDG